MSPLLSARAKFMIETLTNIKNNKVKNLPGGQGQVAAETTTKMKKFLGGLSRKRQGERWDQVFFFPGRPSILTSVGVR